MGCCYSIKLDFLNGLDRIPGFANHCFNLRKRHNLPIKYFFWSCTENNIKVSKMSNELIKDYNQLQKNIIDYLKKEFPTSNFKYFEVFDKEKGVVVYNIDTWFKNYTEYNALSYLNVKPFIEYKCCINRIVQQEHILSIIYNKLLTESVNIS